MVLAEEAAIAAGVAWILKFGRRELAGLDLVIEQVGVWPAGFHSYYYIMRG